MPIYTITRPLRLDGKITPGDKYEWEENNKIFVGDVLEVVDVVRDERESRLRLKKITLVMTEAERTRLLAAQD